MQSLSESPTEQYTVILPTLGRTEEVILFLKSVLSQTHLPTQVVIIDQNTSDDLWHAVKKHFGHTPLILHERVDWVGLSRARNHGLKSVTSHWVFFGDDDSTFPEDYFQTLIKTAVDSGCHAVSTRIRDAQTGESMLNQPSQIKQVTAFNIHSTTCEGATIWQRTALEKLGGYNENMGLGRYYGAEEGADLILRALKTNYSIRYWPGQVVFHPSQRQAEPERFLRYARGTGYFVRRHFSHPAIWLFLTAFIIKNIAGVVLKLADRSGRKKHAFRLLGLYQGLTHQQKASVE